MDHIAVIDDDVNFTNLIQTYYEARKYKISVFNSADELFQHLDAHSGNAGFDAIITDLHMPHVPEITGLEFVQQLKQQIPNVPIIVMTSDNDLQTAITAVEVGAYDFLLKPVHFPQLTISLQRAIRSKQIEVENEKLKTVISVNTKYGYVACSSQIRSVFDLALKVANTNATVLITGETGSGKDIVARLIHNNGFTKTKPFVAINCSAIPENLLESELFGHAKGAFTGADREKMGLFEEANTGTIFLDEIGDLSLGLQAKLLRVLQEKKIKRVGESKYRDIDTRIVTATHKELQSEIVAGRFREDLYFRLNVIPIRVPPLRERQDDIIPLVEYFLRKSALKYSKNISGITKTAHQWLLNHNWPGNVRELENMVERAVILTPGDSIDVSDLGHQPAPATTTANQFTEFKELTSLEEINLKYIEYVLAQAGGVREKAAKILGIDRKTLYRKLARLETSASQH